jgi:hypothetical protein
MHARLNGYAGMRFCRAHVVLEGRGWGAAWSSAAAHMHVLESVPVRPGKTAWCVMCCAVCRVVWQTEGATPLLIASGNGHLKCVLALLRGGAAINQAMVGSRVNSIRRPEPAAES